MQLLFRYWIKLLILISCKVSIQQNTDIELQKNSMSKNFTPHVIDSTNMVNKYMQVRSLDLRKSQHTPQELIKYSNLKSIIVPIHSAQYLFTRKHSAPQITYSLNYLPQSHQNLTMLSKSAQSNQNGHLF